MRWYKLRTIRNLGLLSMLGVVFILAGCSLPSTSAPAEPSGHTVPTVAAMFTNERPTMPPLITPSSQDSVRPPVAQGSQQPQAAAPRIWPIFTDRLDVNWSLEKSNGVRYRLSERYAEPRRAALEVTPTVPWGQLFFTVPADAQVSYRRDQVLGVGFRLYGGDGFIATNDLAVAVVGSNAYPYWVPNDTSVKLEGRNTSDQDALFSETRLYYLGLNRDIPPHTWVEIFVELDAITYDALYTYVTGFYIKNDENFKETFYVDNVHLVMVP
jgi:hypothetical protein